MHAFRHVIVLETSASMVEDWGSISKAVKELVRYQLPDSSLIALVTFSNKSRIEAPLTRVGGNRHYLADSVPDKYRLAELHHSCVLCGLNSALDALGSNKEGGNVILATRGGRNSLNEAEQKTVTELTEYFQVNEPIRDPYEFTYEFIITPTQISNSIRKLQSHFYTKMYTVYSHIDLYSG